MGNLHSSGSSEQAQSLLLSEGEGITIPKSDDESQRHTFVMVPAFVEGTPLDSFWSVIIDGDTVSSYELPKLIVRIRKQNQSVPIFLLGKATTIKNAELDADVEPHIVRTIKKPVSQSQLELMVNASNSTTGGAPTESTTAGLPLVKVGLPLLAVVGATTFFFLSSDNSDNSSQAPIEAQQPLETEVADIRTEESPSFSEVNQLVRQAELASKSGRLIGNKNSALALYTQALEIDAYDANAYNGRKSVIDSLQVKAQQLLSSGNTEQAKEIADAIFDIDPLNQKNNSLLEDINAEPASVAERSETSQPKNKVASAAPTKPETRPSATADTGIEKSDQIKDQINQALAENRLVPPARDNAYTLITNAARSKLISSAQISSLTSELASRLESQVESDIKDKNTKAAKQRLSYLKRLGDTQATIKFEKRIASVEKEKFKPTPKKVANSTPAQDAPVKQTASAAPTNRKAEIIKRVEPKYPKRAVKLNIEGWVELKYRVNAQGQTTDIAVIAGEPGKIFNNAGKQALAAWKYKPAIDPNTNQPTVSDEMTTKFNFSLSSRQ